ncbi:MAG: methyltransferase domain-containing protein [Acetatifactor sp.]|nr:methyltransferase domain-containing protein [Acetatifactor sp.]
MDLNETTEEVLNRHPWELSRTRCVLNAFSKYMDRQHKNQKRKRYINVGAGDLYFDKVLIAKYKKDEVYAVDLAYKDLASEEKNIHKYHYLEEIEVQGFDYAIMMDSLEYMEDDVDYVTRVSSLLRKGGYFFFTLPAFPSLFSDHDINVRNLRRYSRRSFFEVIHKVPGLKIKEDHNFYTSLFLVRFLQKLLHLPIDREHKVTTGWRFKEKGLITRFITGCLNLDFAVNRELSRVGIRLPGLSMLVVCRKVD